MERTEGRKEIMASSIDVDETYQGSEILVNVDNQSGDLGGKIQTRKW